jgi:hypothetical protein
VLDWSLPALSRNPFSYEANAPLLTRLLKLVTLSPLLAAIFWSAMTWWLLHSYYEYARIPSAVAFALAALCSIICLGSYGFLHWQASKFRMTLTTGICFILVVLIVLALQLGFTLFIIDRPESAFIVFMSFNLAPVMLIAYLHGVIAPPITFQQLLRLQGRDPKFEQECAVLQKKITKLKWALLVLSIGALLAFALLMHYLFDSAFGWQVSAAVLFCDFACFVHNSSGLSSDPLLLHFLSIFARAVLFIAWIDHWFVAVSINFLVFIAFFVYHIVDRRYPLFSKEDALDSVVGSIESAMDEKRQKDQAERVQAHEEAELAARQLEERQNGGFSLTNAAAQLERGVDEIRLALREHVPGARFVSDGAEALHAGAIELAEELERKTSSAFKSPEFALGLLSLIYVVYVFVALYADVKNPSWSHSLFPQIVLSSPHPQYQFGVFTALVLVCATLFFLAFRCYEINSFHWNKRVALAGAGFLIISIAASIGVSILTHSNYIYIFGIYLPLIAVVSTLTYCNWRRQDYRWNSWIYYQESVWRKQVKEKRNAKEKQDEEELQRKHTQSLIERDQQDGNNIRMRQLSSNTNGGASSSEPTPMVVETTKPETINLFPFSKQIGGMLSLTLSMEYNCPHVWDVEPTKDPRFLYHFAKDFISFKHTAPDYIIFISLGVLALLCVGLGIHLGEVEDPSTSYLLASLIGMFIFTIFVLLKWFNTFTVGYIQIVVLFGLLTHCSISLHVAQTDGWVPVGGDLPSIGLALLYPAGMAFFMAMYSWKSNGWKLSELIQKLIGVASFLILAYIITFMIMTKLYLEGMIALVLFCVSLYFIILVMVWSSNDFHLPKIYFQSAVGVSTAIILLALIIILILNKTWFQMFTVLWVLSLIGLLAYTIQETRENDTRKLLPSPYIFPVYEYQPALNEIKIAVRNNGLISLIIFAGLMMTWGFIAALLIKPPYIGWIFFCLGGLLFFLISLEALFKPIITFWRNFRLVQDAPALIDHAREQALKSQLGSGETMFGSGNGEENASGIGGGDNSDSIDDDDLGGQDEDGDETGNISSTQGDDDSLKTLRRLQQYWQFEEKSEVDHLRSERKKFILRPQVPEDADVSERARFIAATIANFDAKIAKVFEEQTRILVMFQLLINMGAQALAKKNRARVKDFLRKYFARKMEIQAAKEAGQPIPKRRRTTVATAPANGSSSVSAAIVEEDEDDMNDDYPLIDLSKANAIEIHEWAKNNEELKKKAWIYVQELQESGQEAKRKQEEQRAAAIERKKLATGGATVVPMPQTPIATPVKQPMKQQEKQPIVAVMPAVSQAPATSSPRSGFIGDPTKVTRDDFAYRQRGVSFDVEHLNIRGPTAESVVQQARTAVKEIIRKHSKVSEANKGLGIDETAYFADPFFPQVADLDQLIEAGTDPADKAASGGGNKKRKACWKRMRELSAKPKIFAQDKLDPALIIQGDLEDCYLLSALSVIARTPERIRNLFLVDEYNEYGIYGMTFFVDGEWRAVFVDDQFPFLGNKLAFARSKNPDEFWIPILEKAYAKLYAGYPSIIGGLVHVSFKDLTGGITDEIALDTADSGAFDGRLWQRMMSYHTSGYLMGCGNPKPNAGNFTVVNGIVQGHAYAVS